MTVYVLMKTSEANYYCSQVVTYFKGVYGSKEKAWEAIERNYYPLLKAIEETKNTIREVRIDSDGLTIVYENFIEDLYFYEAFNILETEVK